MKNSAILKQDHHTHYYSQDNFKSPKQLWNENPVRVVQLTPEAADFLERGVDLGEFEEKYLLGSTCFA